MSRDTRTLKLSGEEMAALLDDLPDPDEVEEMTPLRDGIDKVAATKRELEARKNKKYYSCRPEYGDREQAYRDVLRQLTGFDVVGASVCHGPIEWFAAVNANRAKQFDSILDSAQYALARGSRERRGL